MNTTDGGIVIYYKPLDAYYTGMGFDKQLRNAKIYHSRKYVDEAIKYMPSKFKYSHEEYAADNFELYEVDIKVLSHIVLFKN